MAVACCSCRRIPHRTLSGTFTVEIAAFDEVNQSFAGGGIRDPILRERGRREGPYLAEVRERHAARLAWIPWYAEPPVGPDRLLQFARGAAERTDSPTFA